LPGRRPGAGGWGPGTEGSSCPRTASSLQTQVRANG
jgi:hypothetical protein